MCKESCSKMLTSYPTIQTVPNRNTVHLYRKMVLFIIRKKPDLSSRAWNLLTGLTLIPHQKQNRVYIKIDITRETIYIGM